MGIDLPGSEARRSAISHADRTLTCRLLCRRTQTIEADVCEEATRRTRNDTTKSVRHETCLMFRFRLLLQSANHHPDAVH